MSDGHDAPPPLPPPLPIAKRLNRNALTVAAVLMGVTVLVSVVTLNSKRPANETKSSSDVAVPTNARPSFLDLPARHHAPMPGKQPSGGTDTIPTEMTDRTLPSQPGSAVGQSYAVPYTNPYAVLPTTPLPVDPAVAAHRRALASPVVPGSSTSPAATDSRSDSAQARQRAVMSAAASAFRLDAGTVIPAAILRAINSDLPGQLVAQVTRNIYDSRTLQTLLIPQGAKLIGQYDAEIAAGQNRMRISWTRLIFPDGRSCTIPEAPAGDGRGAAGVPGHVDNHYRRVFGTALLTSAISAAIQLSQPQQATNSLGTASARQVAAGALGQELSQVGLQVLRRNLDLRPTITLLEGAAINVLLSGDLDLPGPYPLSHQ